MLFYYTSCIFKILHTSHVELRYCIPFIPTSLQLQCCGVNGYMDYQEIFNNFSVPVSCCNTTSPLANETTCPEIVLDVNDFENEIAIFSEVEWSDYNYAYAFKCMCITKQIIKLEVIIKNCC